MPDNLILLAEDNPVSRRVARAMLEHLGFQADVVADGAQAVNAATVTPYRAILMDCQMPEVDGYQATSEIRRLQEAGTRTPIIAITASTEESDRQRCLLAGMDDFLSKPITLEALGAVLARWVDSGGPVLDAEVVARLERLGRATDDDLMGQLATVFLVESDTQVLALRQALADDDAAGMGRLAHALHGASANIGATGLTRLCATLEADGTAGDLAGGGVLLDALESELGRVRVALGSVTSTP